ncbi:hypothetical protein RB195_014605 [Necator americanus]|uniref:Uncharacterized protein n=1 Tax=Necator americanus TaxID=51031 RepID=A0ABR1E0Y4_NECAM
MGTRSPPRKLSKTKSTKSYVFRQVRAPQNRHLDEIVSSDVKKISNAHYLDEIARTIDSAALCRCPVRYDKSGSSSSSTSSESSSPHRIGSMSGAESPAFSYENPNVADMSATAQAATGSVVSTNADKRSSNHEHRFVRRQRMSLRSSSRALKRFRRRLLVLDRLATQKAAAQCCMAGDAQQEKYAPLEIPWLPNDEVTKEAWNGVTLNSVPVFSQRH